MIDLSLISVCPFSGPTYYFSVRFPLFILNFAKTARFLGRAVISARRRQ